MLSDDSLLREMAHLHAVINRNARNAVGGMSLTGALAILSGHEVAIEEGFASRSMSQADLAQVMGIRPQSVGALVSQMEEKGYARRVSCERDHRAHLLELTDKGREKAHTARERQLQFAKDALSVLTQEEKTQLTTLVLKLNAALS